MINGELSAFAFPHSGGYSVIDVLGVDMSQELVDAISKHASEKLIGYEKFVRERANKISPVEAMPAELGQYLFAIGDGLFTLWNLTSSGWFDSEGVHYESPLKRASYTVWQSVVRGVP